MDGLKNQINRIKSSQVVLLLFSTLITVIIFSIASPGFFAFSSLTTILETVSIIMILSFGETFMLTAGEWDISVGAILSVPTVLTAVLLHNKVPLIIALIFAFILTVLLTFISAVLTVKVKIPSFIATLGVNGIAMGLSRIIGKNTSIKVENKTLLNVFGGQINIGTFTFSTAIIWIIIMFVAALIILNRTKIGRNIQCVGDNRNAAILYGINVNKTVIIVFIINAIFIFIAAMLMLSRSTFATPGEGEAYTLSAIVASIIGGTSIQGGKGSIRGALLGTFFVGCISYGLFRLSVNAWSGGIITGVVIIIVLSISSLNQKRKREMERS